MKKEKKNNQCLARNSSYKQVVFNKEIPLGSFVETEIVSSGRFHLRGKTN